MIPDVLKFIAPAATAFHFFSKQKRIEGFYSSQLYNEDECVKIVTSHLEECYRFGYLCFYGNIRNRAVVPAIDTRRQRGFRVFAARTTEVKDLMELVPTRQVRNVPNAELLLETAKNLGDSRLRDFVLQNADAFRSSISRIVKNESFIRMQESLEKIQGIASHYVLFLSPSRITIFPKTKLSRTDAVHIVNIIRICNPDQVAEITATRMIAHLRSGREYTLTW